MSRSRPAILVATGLVVVALLTTVAVLVGPKLMPQTEPPPALDAEPAWDVAVASNTGNQLSLHVVDRTGRIVGARPTEWDEAFLLEINKLTLHYHPDPRVVVVAWTALTCDRAAELRLSGDGTLGLTFETRGPCDLVPTGYAVELQFRDPVDPATLTGRIKP